MVEGLENMDVVFSTLIAGSGGWFSEANQTFMKKLVESTHSFPRFFQ
jgi:hypothetical protein